MSGAIRDDNPVVIGLSTPTSDPRRPSPGWWRSRILALRQRRDDDAGLSMVELIVAMSIFAMVSTAFAYGLGMALVTTRDDRLRGQASNLASRELEIVRNEFNSSTSAPMSLGNSGLVTNPHQLPGATQGQPLVVDGTAFTIRRNVQWLPAGTGASVCDGGSGVTYPSLAVNVRTSWTEGTRTRDVESNTILTPPKGTLTSNLGFIAAKLTGADGNGVPDVPVTARLGGATSSATTAEDGCAVFALSTAGTYTVELNATNYVSFEGAQATQKTAVVSPSTIQIVPFSYDRAATLNLHQRTAEGFALPTQLPMFVLYNSGLVSGGLKTVAATLPASSPTTVAPLWPFTNGYSVWAGSCPESDPGGTGTRPAAVVPAAGGTETAYADLHPITISLMHEDEPRAGRTLRATAVNATPATNGDPVLATGCGSDSQLNLGTTDTAGILKTSLPRGTWLIEAFEGSTLVARGTSPTLAEPVDTQGNFDTSIQMTLVVP